MEFVAISSKGVEIYSTASSDPSKPKYELPTGAKSPDGFTYSPDGLMCGVLTQKGDVDVYDCTKGYTKILTCQQQESFIRNFYFSPKGTFLVTYERYSTETQKENVHLWHLETGEIICSLILKQSNQRMWPCFKWTKDERVCVRMVTNELHFLSGRRPQLTKEATLFKLRLPNIASFELSPDCKTVACFVGENKGQPGMVKVYSISSADTKLLGQKSFFNCQTCNMVWNNDGTSLLMTVHQESGRGLSQNYYGSTGLYFLRPSPMGQAGQNDLSLCTNNEPAQASAWSPNTNEFIALVGDMPPTLSLNEGVRGVSKVTFGRSRRNTLLWSPNGRYFLSGGFGNLPGEADVWDKEKHVKLTTMNLPCTVLSDWGADGRTLLTASIAPRMRVDNHIKLHNYDGRQTLEIPFDELYYAGWRPMDTSLFEDQAPSPRVVKAATAAAKKAAKEPVAKAKAAYKPPSGGAFAAALRAERHAMEKTEVKVEYRPPSRAVGAPANLQELMNNLPQKLPPGMTVPLPQMNAKTGSSSTASRNARKRANRAAAKAAKEEEEAEQRQKAEEEEKKAKEKAAAAAEREAHAEEGKQHTTDDKRLRNLRKKLKEVTALKALPSDSLNEAQMAKIGNESNLVEEIKEIEARLG
ncbi:Eukaryotic translation initiation factor 2A [Perkinsus olseni]|uniref:Eukaryotic translation initiation factor 2A n=4 Tax=Perkinsus olseni TaxID=32597 RepID=A0A7J6PFX0_PEROL|nr:Eukaryotic translation initiation factor 2A [Perkinsus olseni]